jgi:hypothetical protein
VFLLQQAPRAMSGSYPKRFFVMSRAQPPRYPKILHTTEDSNGQIGSRHEVVLWSR